jgi:circadian clock protein KaiC
LVIDGVSGFQQSTLEPERIVRFWSALLGELRVLGVTTLHTMELSQLMGVEIAVPVGDVSSLSDVLVLFRYVELRSRLLRMISLFKVREGSFDPTIREFEVTDAGIVIGKPFEGVEAVLSGMARAAAARAAALTLPESDDTQPSVLDRTGQPG